MSKAEKILGRSDSLKFKEVENEAAHLFHTHSFFDMYAFGMILEKMLDNYEVKAKLGMKIIIRLSWLKAKCI